MNVCFITIDYPDEKRSVFPFVKQLVDEIANQGHICQVVAPYSITKNKRLHKFKEKNKKGNGEIIVYRPNYMSFSRFKVGNVSLTSFFHQKAVDYALKCLEYKPDVIYGHFWCSGLEGFKFAHKNNIPLFVATGESNIRSLFDCSEKYAEFYNYVKGVICVSTKNKQESINLGLTTEEKCVVIPNAIDSNKFKLQNKIECRKKLNISSSDFVVAFVGSFIERKGTCRVSDAITKLGDNSIRSIFIGAGNQNPNCNGIIFKGKLQHDQITTYLNAADVFVLPTLAEGCCNAIIEAMACGLPIISSDLSFNYDILDKSNAILIDPMDVNAIREAICKLKNDVDLRKKLSIGSLKKAESLTIAARAERIERVIKSGLS